MANRFFPNYSTYIITSPFGLRTLNGTTRQHNGIDLVANSGKGYGATDYITAHSGGTVSGVGYDSSAGNFINIKVSENTIMVYYHMKERSTLKIGDVVSKGQVIGYMGSTGNSTGAHLHWGIKHNGSWINPEPYLDKDFTESKKEEVKVEQKVKVELDILRKGATSAQVKTLQRLLIALGYKMKSGLKTYGVDGSFGIATENALKSFQKAEGLDDDGVCGPQTWNALLK